MKFKKFICISTIICTVSLSFLGCKDTDSSSADTPEVKSESQTSASANTEISETDNQKKNPLMKCGLLRQKTHRPIARC